MKEQLYTIPLNEAMEAQDECPFCFIERAVERDVMDFCLGNSSSYMEADIRQATDQAGFCRMHFQKMFVYGNTLGNAWILKTHYRKTIQEMKQQFASFSPGRVSLKDKLRGNTGGNSISMWVSKKNASCYICDHFKDNYTRYMDTFFYMYSRDEEFREKVKNSRGFCLTHFGDLCSAADERLSEKELKQFYDVILPLMERNMERLYEDVSWMVEKFDYQNRDADWKNSRDAIQRGMQKLKGGYPADPPYKMNK